MRNQTKAWLKAHPDRKEKFRTRAKVRYYQSPKGQLNAKRNRCKRYGITVEEYDEMYAQQLGLCRICHKPFPVLHIDHKHVDGFELMPPEEKRKYVRGLLCGLDNQAIGLMEEDPARMRSAANYVELGAYFKERK
jgi:hypothetical protein